MSNGISNKYSDIPFKSIEQLKENEFYYFSKSTQGFPNPCHASYIVLCHICHKKVFKLLSSSYARKEAYAGTYLYTECISCNWHGNFWYNTSTVLNIKIAIKAIVITI